MAQEFEGTSNSGEPSDFKKFLLEHKVSETTIQSLIDAGLDTMYAISIYFFNNHIIIYFSYSDIQANIYKRLR